MNKAFTKKAVTASLLLSIVWAFSCRPKVCPEALAAMKIYNGNCLGTFVYHADRNRVEISPRAACAWTNLVDLSLFEGFQPGMTIKKARRQVGEPDEEVESGGNRFWRYRRKAGVVQVGHEDQGSTLFIDRWWVLRAYPSDSSARVIFSPDIVSRLPATAGRYEVVVLNQCRLPMLEVSMEGSEVQLITWIENPGSRAEALAPSGR